jgi:type IV secretory pathway TrbD component
MLSKLFLYFLHRGNHIRSEIIILAGILTAILDAVINQSLVGITTLVFLFLGTLVIVFRYRLDGFLNAIARYSRRYKIASSVLTVLGTFLLIDALSTPAKAQFFQSAESWMTGQFTGAGDAIILSFNVLRGLFILYLGISLVRVVQGARQDEDWTNLARTPMIILIAVTMGDILSNLIIGGGGGTGTGGGTTGGGTGG